MITIVAGDETGERVLDGILIINCIAWMGAFERVIALRGWDYCL